MRKKTLLVIDWSNIMFRSLFMNQLYSDSTTYDRIEDMRSFTYKFAMDMCAILNIFKPDNVIIAADSQHVWRKEILAGETEGYKSNRTKNQAINWDNIYKCADDLQEIFEKHGAHIAKMDHSEADDMVALCKELVFEKYHNYNIIIVSADADLRQLIDFDKDTAQYCIVYNTTGKPKTKARNMYVTEEFYNWFISPDPADIFFTTMDYNKQYIKDIITANGFIQMQIENPNKIVLSKIFCGDDGDCVPSFYTWYHNGRSNRITPKRAERIMENAGIYSVNDLLKSEPGLKPIIEKVCKREINDIDISERIQRQRELVELNSTLFPEDIRDYKDTIEYMLDDIPQSGFHNMRAQDILAGTEYEGHDKRKVLEADIFKDMSKYINKDTIPIF